jgi:transposase InsO family protein
MSYPLVRELAAEGIPVVVTCRVLGFSPRAFSKWRANPVSARDWSDAHLVDAAREIHADDPVFGYRFIADELRAERGIRASENRVHRLCRQHGLSSVLARKRGRGLKPGPAVHDDLVRRAFSASRPNELWLTDITEHRTDEGKLYLCAIKDACSNRIVAYSIDERMKASLAVAALRNAVGLRSPQGTVVHSTN